jgi:hypothetical protein
MSDNAQLQLADSGAPLLDKAYLAWFSAESEAEQALHTWFEAARGDRAEAYRAYHEALEREDAAARDLQRLSETPEPCLQALSGDQAATG